MHTPDGVTRAADAAGGDGRYDFMAIAELALVVEHDQRHPLVHGALLVDQDHKHHLRTFVGIIGNNGQHMRGECPGRHGAQDI